MGLIHSYRIRLLLVCLTLVYTLLSSQAADAESQCETDGAAQTTASQLKKNTLFTQFPRKIPSQSTLGKLHSVDTALPNELARRLGAEFTERINLGLKDTRYPASPQLIRNLAAQMETQFIVTGSVTSMELTNPIAYEQQSLRSEIWHNLKKTPKDQRDNSRYFSFDLKLFDGLTGNLMFARNFNSSAPWNAEPMETMGFASPRFWQLAYGKMVDGLIAQAVTDLQHYLACQPLVTNIELSDQGALIYVKAGTNQGIKTGDTLELHLLQENVFPKPSSSLSPTGGWINQRHLMKLGQSLSVVETYPEYSLATAPAADSLSLNKAYYVLAR